MKVSELEYRISDGVLFKGINLHFTKGVIVISGNNGCGKSTLLRILSGLCRPHRGQVLYQGVDLYANPMMKQSLGYVPSAPFLYPHLTLNENLQICALMHQLPKSQFKDHLNWVLKQCQLNGFENVLFAHCSDGVQKRAMIASSMIHRPTLLILDEPTTALSWQSRDNLWALLNQLATNGVDIILSSHQREDIHYCTQHYVLEKGKLLLQDNRHAFSEIILSQQMPLPTNQEHTL